MLLTLDSAPSNNALERAVKCSARGAAGAPHNVAPAAPGDTIEVRNGALYLNSRGVVEPYVHVQQYDQPYLRDVPAVKLGPDEYHVLGDFRDQSKDSREFGPISRDQLLGRIETICFSHLAWRIGWDRFPEDLSDDT